MEALGETVALVPCKLWERARWGFLLGLRAGRWTLALLGRGGVSL